MPNDIDIDRNRLLEVLDDARDLGFLGPDPVGRHVEHAFGFLSLWPPSPACGGQEPPLAIDLGSGGGVPGLVLASSLPAVRWRLLDSNRRRTKFLSYAVERLGLSSRVEVIAERAEIAGRSSLRGQAAVVVARSFAPPAVTAECAAPLLAVGGYLLVAEPPGPPAGETSADGFAPSEAFVDGPSGSAAGGLSSTETAPDRSLTTTQAGRWPPAGLALFGMVPDAEQTEPFALRRFRQREACPERYPRRVGVPAKRPLF